MVEASSPRSKSHPRLHRRRLSGAADKLIRKIIGRGEQIATFPNSGRTVPDFGFPSLRELIERPYRIIYVVRSDEVIVVTVLHSSRVLRVEMLF